MSYGADQLAIVRRTAVYVDKILKGARPGELPVEQPTRLQLLLNLKTAKALWSRRAFAFPAACRRSDRMKVLLRRMSPELAQGDPKRTAE
jgi:hypothetical protein